MNDTRERILAAAEPLFIELGYHRTTTKKLARAAGVAEGTLYLHFAHKDELLFRVLEANLQRFLAEIAPRLHPARPVEENLRAFLDVMLGHIRAKPRLRLLIDREGSYLPPEYYHPLQLIFDELQDRVDDIFDWAKGRGALRAEMSSRLLTQALLGTVQSICRALEKPTLPHEKRQTLEKPETTIAAIIELLLDGARPHGRGCPPVNE